MRNHFLVMHVSGGAVGVYRTDNIENLGRIGLRHPQPANAYKGQ